ncbi:MAG: hypothetical protein ACQKBW_08900 [Puniceicoccales bacterium]
MNLSSALSTSACVLALSLTSLHADQALAEGFSLSDNDASVHMNNIGQLGECESGAVRFPGEEEILLTIIPFGEQGKATFNRERFTQAVQERIAMSLTGTTDTDSLKDQALGPKIDQHCTRQGMSKPHCYLAGASLTPSSDGASEYSDAVMFILTDKAILQAVYSPYPGARKPSGTTPAELMKQLAMSLEYSSPTPDKAAESS